MKKDYYELLGVSKSSSPDEIKKGYRKMAMQFHPDRNPGNKESEEKFKEVNEAYEVLSNPEKKKMYDQFGHAAFSQNMGGGHRGGGGFNSSQFDFGDIFGGDFEDIFDSFGGLFGSRKKRTNSNTRQPERGRDMLVEVEITLEEALSGAEKIIKMNRKEECSVCNGKGTENQGDMVTCPKCNGRGETVISQGLFTIRQTCSRCGGSGTAIKNPCKKCSGSGTVVEERKIKVNIPAGIDNGTRLKMSNEGEAGKNGGPRGSLYIEVHVKPHPVFERKQGDLYTKIKVSYTTMILGGEITLTNLDNNAVKLRIPSLTENNQFFKIKEQGMPSIDYRKERGNLFVQVEVEIPKKISSKAKKLLEELDHELK